MYSHPLVWLRRRRAEALQLLPLEAARQAREFAHHNGAHRFRVCQRVIGRQLPESRARREVMDLTWAATGGWTDFKPRVRDGRTFDASWAEVRLSDGTTIGIGAESTGRKRTEEALRESEQRLLQLAGQVREVLWNTGPQGLALPDVRPA
jgi:PAS domain-containing protein